MDSPVGYCIYTLSIVILNKKGIERMRKRKKMDQLLEQKGMTAYALAKEVGYKPQTVYNWLYGCGTPTPTVMLKMMKVLNISAQEVLEIFAEGDEESGRA